MINIFALLFILFAMNAVSRFFNNVATISYAVFLIILALLTIIFPHLFTALFK